MYKIITHTKLLTENGKVLFDLKAHGLVEAMNSLPDGMTIDNEGKLWVAVYGTQKVKCDILT